MTQVPARLAVWLAVIIIIIAFLLGVLHWNAKPYACFGGKAHYGDWVVVYSVGKFEVRAKAWGCTTDNQYDPKLYKKL